MPSVFSLLDFLPHTSASVKFLETLVRRSLNSDTTPMSVSVDPFEPQPVHCSIGENRARAVGIFFHFRLLGMPLQSVIKGLTFVFGWLL